MTIQLRLYSLERQQWWQQAKEEMILVPFYPQEQDYTCGAACLRMVAAVHGVEVSEATFADSCQTLPEVGTTVQGLVTGAMQAGFRARLIAVDTPISDLERTLSAGLPVIVAVDAGLTFGISTGEWHFVVVLQANDEDVIVHDPAAGPERRVGRDRFMSAWFRCFSRGVIVWK